MCVCLDVLECTVNVHGRAWICACLQTVFVCVFLQRDRWEMDGERQHFLSHSIQLDRIY